MDFPQVAVLAAVILTSSVAMSLSGFGFGLISMGFFPIFMPVVEANVIVSLLAIPVILVNLAPLRRYLKPRTLIPIFSATLVGTPIGIWVLVGLEERVLLLGLGSLILITLLVNEISARGRIRQPSVPIALGAGFLGGIFGGAYSISGPPVTLYLTSIFESKNELKANLLFYFLMQIVFRFVLLFAGGIATATLVKTAALLLLPLAVGTGVGMKLFTRISSRTMRRITQVLLALSSIMLILRAL